MTLKEFIDYCVAIAVQTGTEPTSSPFIDGEMVLEFLLPAVLREAVRQAYRNNRHLETLIKASPFELNRGYASLPTGFEEEFADSFQLAQIGKKTLRSGIAGAFASIGGGFAANSSAFTQDDVGFEVLFVGTGEDDEDGFLTTILQVVSATVVVLDTSDFPIGGTEGVGTLKIYETQWVATKQFDNVSMSNGSPTFTDDDSQGILEESDEGNLVLVYDDDVLFLRGMIELFNGVDEVDLHQDAPGNLTGGTATVYERATIPEYSEGYYVPERVGLFSNYPHYADFERETGDILPRFCVRDSKIFVKDADDATIADGTGLVLYGVFVPQIPDTEDDQILVGEQILDDSLVIAAALIKGERPLSSVGISIPVKK